MANTRANPIVRFLPGLTDVVFLMPIVFLFARMEGAKTMLGDGDTGWHIRTGEWIMANGRVPHNDVFSFTKAGDPWFAWEWLWDVCFAWIYHHGGLAAVVAASMAVICITFALLFRLVRRHCDNPFLAVAITFLACAASSLHWLARPHLFTMLFVVVLLFILDYVKEGHTRLLLTLPVLTVVWTNLHGGFLVEFIILAACIAGEIVRAVFVVDSRQSAASWRTAMQYTAVACVCAAATLINPYTYHLHAHILRYFSEPYHLQNIAEYQSISFHSGVAVYLESMLMLAAIGGVWFVIKRRDFTPLILMLGWAHLALFAARNVPLFAIIAAPFIAQSCSEMLAGLEQARITGWLHRLLAGLRNAGTEFQATDRLWRTHAVSLASVVVIATLLSNPNATGRLKPEYDPAKYPATALTVLRSLPDARIFADDEWGDYLIYQLYPRHKVFVDGRSDFYGQEFEQKYLDLIMAKYDWEQYLRKYKVDTVVLSPDNALSTAIKESRNWRVIYDDTVAIVFTAVQQPPPGSKQFSAATWGGKNRNPVLTKRAPRERGITADKQSKGV
jgi:hypothetical protein